MSKKCPEKRINSLEHYLRVVRKDTSDWKLSGCPPWFRGQSTCAKPPLPGILRHKEITEADINSKFFKMAPMFGEAPAKEDYPEWLYLMQHVGVPTRLLDWSEGALIGLFFALSDPKEEDAGVWVLNPLEFNKATIGKCSFPEPGDIEFDQRCQLAFYGSESDQKPELKHPIAIIPRYTHKRMKSQKSCFTLHGTSVKDFEQILKDLDVEKGKLLRRYRIPKAKIKPILKDLRLMGITYSTIFPDLDGLALDLKNAYLVEGTDKQKAIPKDCQSKS